MKYPISMRLLHWIMSILIMFNLALGICMSNLTANTPQGLRSGLFGLHKSLGLCILLLVLLRIITRLSSKMPNLPQQISKRDVILSKIIQISIYVLMLYVPIIGYVAVSASGYGISFFNLFSLPLIIERNHYVANFTMQLHIVSAYILLCAIVLHIAGFLKHLLIEKTNLLKRMV